MVSPKLEDFSALRKLDCFGLIEAAQVLALGKDVSGLHGLGAKSPHIPRASNNGSLKKRNLPQVQYRAVRSARQ